MKSFVPVAKTSKDILTARQYDEVEKYRDLFQRNLKEFPEPISAILTERYELRRLRQPSAPMLGEYAPWLLKDILPLKQPQRSIKSVAGGWISIYAYTILIDDLLDKSQSNDDIALLGTSLLLQRGISDLISSLPQTPKARIAIDRYFMEAATAVLTELKDHRKKLSDYTDADVNALGSKVALLKLCAVSLLLADRTEDDFERLLLPVHSLAVGMQLLDDLGDWKEDWKEGNYTPIITRAFANKNIDGLETEYTEAELLILLIETESIEWSIQEATKHLRAVVNTATKPSSGALKLLSHIIEEYSSFEVEVSNIRTDLLARDIADVKFELSESMQKRIDYVESHLKIIAQNT